MSGVRTCSVSTEPCPVCGQREGYVCSADFLGDKDSRWWACGRQEEARPGGEWRVIKDCGAQK